MSKQWVKEDLAAAAEWASNLPEGKGQETVLVIVVGQWASQDPVAAKEWVEQLPEGEGKNEARKRLEQFFLIKNKQEKK